MARPLVFVSYAQVNNDPLPNEKEGRVSTLVRFLSNHLTQKLGKEGFELKFDLALEAGFVLEPGLEELVRGSAILLVVHSEGYKRSDWCSRKELTWFLDEEVVTRKADPARSRIVIVELDPSERPAVLKDILGKRLYEVDDVTKRLRPFSPFRDDTKVKYENIVLDLADDIGKELKRQSEPVPSAESRAEATSPAIFLAPVTDDLIPMRDRVKRYLSELEHRILPEVDYPSDSVAAFQEAARNDLERSALFVQLLGRKKGLEWFADDLTVGLASLLHQTALDLKSPQQILQWCDAKVRGPSGTDDLHQRLLLGPTVSIAGSVEFMQMVVARYKELTSPPPQIKDLDPELEKLVFIDAERTPAWRAVARRIRDELYMSRRIGCVMLNDEVEDDRDPRKIRDDLLKCCDALIFVGGSNPLWLRQEREAFIKLKREREKLQKRTSVPMALCEGPPRSRPCEHATPNLPCFWRDKDVCDQALVAASYRFPGVELIDCRAGVCVEGFERFVHRIKEERADAGEAGVSAS
jgi:hypothetical protein